MEDRRLRNLVVPLKQSEAVRVASLPLNYGFIKMYWFSTSEITSQLNS